MWLTTAVYLCLGLHSVHGHVFHSAPHMQAFASNIQAMSHDAAPIYGTVHSVAQYAGNNQGAQWAAPQYAVASSPAVGNSHGAQWAAPQYAAANNLGAQSSGNSHATKWAAAAPQYAASNSLGAQTEGNSHGAKWAAAAPQYAASNSLGAQTEGNNHGAKWAAAAPQYATANGLGAKSSGSSYGSQWAASQVQWAAPQYSNSHDEDQSEGTGNSQGSQWAVSAPQTQWSAAPQQANSHDGAESTGASEGSKWAADTQNGQAGNNVDDEEHGEQASNDGYGASYGSFGKHGGYKVVPAVISMKHPWSHKDAAVKGYVVQSSHQGYGGSGLGGSGHQGAGSGFGSSSFGGHGLLHTSIGSGSGGSFHGGASQGHGGQGSGHGGHGEEHEEHHKHEPIPYEFQYFVSDPHTHDVKSQKESSDGHVVKGQYSLIQPDGKLRTVEYVADWKHGFQARVHYSEAPKIDEHGHAMSGINYNLGGHH